ncbi:CMP-N-acetylneuraminate-beta-galactosamide-alpha-2,3-sialyltransferase 4-like [Pelodiscus sinensis]|uniref:Alpha2,3-sialyltransferase n=2 Tax=Pelodiscus sinensis TaxID=13735 RepID=A0A0F7RPZ4_PELSI|nr:CMP-N-acetylneuraminate-beta-galactosamide-alpha-2,3-sialyltransferase 4-like [Pelodiscus sinensis]CDI70282.1 TPA: alpha2,3-sialyltransferase [Pelodiscus sinensis]|eukprot:NP_001303982.1 CMP-N-acetylneuraminate-beta-galactosamide-alpha-2,3-sialyltransferase 4-like [Pelodiscus sinensis]
MNLEGLVCSKLQCRFIFVFLRKLWRVLRLLLSVAPEPLKGNGLPTVPVPVASLPASSQQTLHLAQDEPATRCHPALHLFSGPGWELPGACLGPQEVEYQQRHLQLLAHQLRTQEHWVREDLRLQQQSLEALENQGMPKSIERLRCRRCVVVGNSNSIRGRGFGAVIDSHNVVIRLNNAPVKDHKADVGERTSIRLFFPESAVPNPLDNNNNETLMVLIPFKSLDFTWVMEMLLDTRNKTVEGFWRKPPSEWKWNTSYLRILHPYVTYQATYKLLQLKKKGKQYSTTGIIALNLALHICHEVNIVGFGYPERHDNTTPVHYYDTEHLSQELFMMHNITAEQEWLLKMIERGMISDLMRPSSWSWGPWLG